MLNDLGDKELAIWDSYAAAGLSDGNMDPKKAAERADTLIEERRKRQIAYKQRGKATITP
jgi:hypothetical protein